MIALIAVLLAAVPVKAVAEIKAGRTQSNAAIAAHDFSRMEPLLAPDFTVIPGSRGSPLSKAEFGPRLTDTFRDPTFVTYVRTPGHVTVSSSGKRAVEIGTWIGRWRKADGEMRLTGVYQAMWVPLGAGGGSRMRASSPCAAPAAGRARRWIEAGKRP